jgi:hypothetical protein
MSDEEQISYETDALRLAVAAWYEHVLGHGLESEGALRREIAIADVAIRMVLGEDIYQRLRREK